MNILTSKLGFKILILVSERNVRNIESPFKSSSPSWHWDVQKGCYGNFVISHVKLQINAEISHQN